MPDVPVMIPAKNRLLARMRSYATESLVKNSTFLVINLGITTVSSYGSLILLTHFFSVNTVGLSAAAVSASTLIVSITKSGMNYSLPRVLPTSNHRRALINTVHTGATGATVLGSIIFLLTPFADKMFALGGFLFCVVFLVSTCVQAGAVVLGMILIADRNAGMMVRANTIGNIVKLGSPPAFRFAGNIGALISRVFFNLVSYIILAHTLIQRGHRFKPELSRAAFRELGRFSIGMSVAGIIGDLPLMMLPLIVLSRLGAAQNAYWSIAITIGALLNSLPIMVKQALLPEITHRPTERRRLLFRSALAVTGFVIPILIILYVTSPILAGVIGKSYSKGMLPALHWLIIAAFVTTLNYSNGAILFLAKKSLAITAANAITTVIVFSMAWTWATDAQEIAISWLVGDTAKIVFSGLFALLALRKVGFRLEDLGGSVAPSSSGRVRPVPMPGSVAQAFDALAAIAEQQRLARQQPYLDLQLTEPRGLYTAMALDEAEREWFRRRSVEGNLNQTQPDLYDGTGPGGHARTPRHALRGGNNSNDRSRY